MRSHRIGRVAIALALTTGLAAIASAGEPDKPGQGQPSDNHGASVSAVANAGASASADLEALKQKLEEHGSKVSEAARTKTEREIEEIRVHVDQSAIAEGNEKIAARLGGEFGLSAEAILAQRTALAASWGELLVAHCIAANAGGDVTVEQLMGLRGQGMGWGKIAAGLDLRLGSVVSGVKAEGKVARGMARADGKVSPMSGTGARAGLGVRTGLASGAGNGRSGASAGVGVGVGVGVKGKP